MNVVGRVLRRSAANRAPFRLSVQPSTCFTSTSSLHSVTGPSFKSPPDGKLTDLKQLAESLKSSKDIPSIHSSCSALSAELRKTHLVPPPSPTSSDVDRLLSVLHLLVLSGRDEDWKCIEEILHDLHPVLGMEPSESIYSAMLLRLAEAGYHRQALELLLKMPQLPGYMSPTLKQIHRVLEASSETADLEFMKDCVANMRRMGQRPTPETFAIIFRSFGKAAARKRTPPSFDWISSLVKEYIRQGLPFDPNVARALYDTYARIGDFDRAQEVMVSYQTALGPSHDEPRARHSNLDSFSKSKSTSIRGRDMLRQSKTYADIKRVSQRLGVPSSVDHYSLVMNNCIRSGNISDAFSIYDKSKEDGIVPDSALIAPLLRVLGEERSDEAIDKAMSLYRELADAHALPSPSPQGSKTLDDHSVGPDAAIYDRLFRMLLSSPNFGKYSPIVEALLEEMACRGLPMDTNSVATTQILLEMRRTGSFSEALDVYRERRGHLNEYGFHTVLREYCRMSFVGDLEVPLITQYFGIVNDMRLRQVPITSKVYTIILYSIGITATKIVKQVEVDPAIARKALGRLVATVRRVHDYLTLDASISPDAILWNQLMNAYQRLGCFGDTCRLWEVMYLTRRFDQVSVNIMLDACGHAGRLDVATSMLSKLRKINFALDLQNCNTWVEALCRNGEVDRAVKVVCGELMQQHGLKPNVESIRIISKFARRDKTPPSILRPLQETWPDLWTRLSSEIQNS